MEKKRRNISLVEYHEVCRRRIMDQFMASLSREQRDMLAATAPAPRRRVERALANLLMALDAADSALEEGE